MTATTPETSSPATPTLVSTPMAEGASGAELTAASVLAAIAGFLVSLAGHSVIVVWGIGLWDMASPLSAAPPPAIMVDLVDDPWRAKTSPETSTEPGLGGEAAAPPPPPPAAAAELPTEPQTNGPAAAVAQPAMPFALPSFDGPDPTVVEPGTPTGLRIAQMLQVPVELPVDLPDKAEMGGAAAEIGTGLPSVAIDEFKGHVQSCWTTPSEAVGDERIKVLIRVALRRDGSVLGDPTLVQAVATAAGPAVVKSAIAAVRKCQPYAFLPAEQYKQWRVLDVAFSAKGVM